MGAQRIDVHAHYFGGTVASLMRQRRFPGRTPSWDARATLQEMDRRETAAQILSVPFLPAMPDVVAASAQARSINEELAALAADYPGRFGGFACLPAQDADRQLAELTYAVDVLGLDGIGLVSNVEGRYLGDPSWEPILAEAERRSLPVLVHPTSSPHADQLALGRPPSILEFPFDTARTALDAIYAGVLQRHPRLTVILPHLGGALPSLAWRLAETTGLVEGTRIGPHDVYDALRMFYYDTALAGSEHSLAPVSAVTTTSHLLFGTDAAAATPAAIDHSLQALHDNVTAIELRRIGRTNAAALFPRWAALE